MMKSSFISHYDWMDNRLILLSGVSGSGKTTLLSYLLQAHSQLVLVPSYTSRPMRPNERNGRKYWFLSKKEFEKAIDNNEFLEYAIVHEKHYYGTKLSEVKKAFSRGLVPITEVDMHGLEKIREDSKGISYVSIFLNVDDTTIVSRIKKRGNTDQEEIDRRIRSAHYERQNVEKYCDYVLDTNASLKTNIKNLNQLVKKILNG